MSIPACMGGWCAKRDHCPYFHAVKRTAPAERLCPPGQDGAKLTGSTLMAVQMVQVRHAPRRVPA